MSHNHPIDDLFNRKLSDLRTEPPMHLWEKIDQKRDWKHKLFNQIRLHKQSVLVMTSLVMLVCVWQFTKPVTPALGHFPILIENSSVESNQVATTALDKVLPIAESAVVETNTTSSKTAQLEPRPHIIQKTKPIIKAVAAKTASTNILTSIAAPEIVEDNPLPKMAESEPAVINLNLEEENAQPSAASLKIAELTPLETLDFSLEENRLFGLFNPDPKCAKFKHGHWFLYLDLMASPDIPIRSLKARNNLYYNYVRNREQSESVEFSYSAAFRLSAVSNIGLAIRTGLNYTQINEKFNYYNENEERIIIDNIYGPNGEIIGSDTTIVSGVRHKVTHNKFQIVDLPIILGYELEYQKWVLSLNAGAHINLYFESEGDFLSPELEPVSFSSDDPDGIRAFRNHLGIGWFTSVGVQYKVNPRINLLFEPYFKMYPKGFSRAQYMVEQQYHSMGFSIGIRQKI